MQNLRLKINFWGKYEEELKSLLIEKNKTRIREIFAICYLKYLDEVLTPVENFGIKGEKLSDFSFLERFYMFLQKNEMNCDIMDFAKSSDSYDCEVFKHVASTLCSLFEKEISSILLKNDDCWSNKLNEETKNSINTHFKKNCAKNEKIKNFLKENPDFKFPPMNVDRKDRYWSKVLISSFTDLPEWIWCLVGNIKQSHEYGENNEIRYGTKHFSGGTKVYCFPAYWGDGYENIHVIGKPRKSHKLILIVIKSELIENFRLKQIYDKRVIEEMYCGGWGGWDNSEKSKNEINEMLEWLKKRNL